MYKNRKVAEKIACAGMLLLQVASAQGGMLDIFWKAKTSSFGNMTECVTSRLQSITQSNAVQTMIQNPVKTTAILTGAAFALGVVGGAVHTMRKNPGKTAAVIAGISLALGVAGYVYSCWKEHLDELSSLERDVLVPASMCTAHMARIKYLIDKQINLMSDNHAELYCKGLSQALEEENVALKLYVNAAHELKTLKQQTQPLSQKQIDNVQFKCEVAKGALDKAKAELHRQLAIAKDINLWKAESLLNRLSAYS